MNKNLPILIKYISDGYVNIRKNKDKYVIVLVKPLIKLKVHPNFLTIMGALSAILSVYFLFSNHFLFVLFLVINFLLDILDGTVARVGKYNNPYGKYIDAISDAVFGILILIKSYLYFQNELILIPLLVYLWEAFRIKNWAPGFYPNIFWLKFFFIFKLFKFGIIFQLGVSIFNIIMRKKYKLRYEA